MRKLLLLSFIFFACSNNEIERKLYDEKEEIVKKFENEVDKKEYLKSLLLKKEIEKIDYLIISDMYKNGYNFNYYLDEKDTFITSLIKKGNKIDYEMLIYLKELGYKFDFVDKEENNLIIYGVLNYQNDYGEKILDILLELELDVNKKNINEKTAIVYLLLEQYSNINEEIIKKLLDYNLDLNIKIGKNQDNYLGILANDYNGFLDIELAKFFIKNGVDVNYENNIGEKPIDILIKNQNFNNKSYYLSLLNKKGQLDLNKKNKNGINPVFNLIMNIIQKENQDLLPIFLSLEADIEVVDEEENTLLMYSAMFGKYEVYYKLTEFLLLAGINPNKKNKLGENAINLLVKYGKSSVSTLNLLNLHGADILNKDNMGNNPLHDSIFSYKDKENEAIIEYLISNGGDIYSENKLDYTPLIMAIIYGEKENRVEVVKYFVDLYEDIDTVNSFEYTPLMAAVQFGNNNTFEIIEYLLGKGANINKEQKDGTTALMIAAINTTSTSSIEIVKKLVENGAKIDVTIKEEWKDEKYDIKWEIGDTVIELVQKYINISSSEETLEYLNNL